MGRRCTTTRLARAHFWLHNLGLPVFMVGLAIMLGAGVELVAVTAAGATVLLVGLVLFAANVLMTVRAAPRAAAGMIGAQASSAD